MSEQTTTANQSAPPPSMGNVPVRKCMAGIVLPSHVLDMLKLAPDNPQFRTMVNAIVLQPVPDEAKTYEQIVDWVEFNIDPETIKNRAVRQVAASSFLTDRAAGPTLGVPVTYTYTEYGRCHYKVTRSGRDHYELNLDDIRAAAGNAENWEEFLEDCRERIREAAEDNPPETDMHDDCEHYDYESTETEDTDFEIGQMAGILREHLRQHLPAEFDRLTEDEDADDDEGEEDTDR